MSNNWTKNNLYPNPFSGLTHTEEHKAKMSDGYRYRSTRKLEEERFKPIKEPALKMDITKGQQRSAHRAKLGFHGNRTPRPITLPTIPTSKSGADNE